MADQEIAILIKAVDEMSGTLDKIEGKVTSFSSKTEKASDNVSSSFERSTTSLLALGNMAATADNIFSSYENLQLRLENAQDRVTNSQDSLADAQRKLNKVMTDGVSTSEDIANAQRDVERAQRNVEISTNNQSRAMGMAMGTYINMGVQTITLTNSIVTMAKGIDIAKWSMVSFELTLTPVTVALAAVAAVIGVVTLSSMGAKKETDNLAISFDLLNGNVGETPGLLNSVTSAGGKDGTQQTLIDLGVVVGEQKIEWDDYNKTLKVTQETLGDIITKQMKVEGVKNVMAKGQTGTQQYNNYGFPTSPTINMQDGIITPQGNYSTHPDDYIIATKDPSSLGGKGVQIIITGNNYGTDPNQIAEALFKQIRRKIAI